jgi:hypothetical protein
VKKKGKKTNVPFNPSFFVEIIYYVILQDDNITYKKFEDVLFNKTKDTATNQGFRVVNSIMHTYTQQKKGLSYIYNKRQRI